MKISGLWIPLVTPLYRGHFDKESARKLIETLEPYADGYVAALSTGEGDSLSEELWRETIAGFVSLTDKPVFAGIFLQDTGKIIERSELAKTLGCSAVVILTISGSEEKIVDFFSEINTKTSLPVVMYSEAHPIKNIETLERLDNLNNIIAVKESSADDTFIRKISEAKSRLRMSVLQGMDHKLLLSTGYDGFMIALANVEPDLCRRMLENPTEETNKKIIEKFWEYNMGGEWFVTLKALLCARGTLRSAEQVTQTIHI